VREKGRKSNIGGDGPGEASRLNTLQTVLFGDARNMAAIGSDSVDLVVTSPPYPMIGMWDEVFATMNPEVARQLDRGDGRAAFELMHGELDKVWRESFRVLKPGSIASINIGDAVRTIDGDFRMYSNHARIIPAMIDAGFTLLPDIIWRKPTNSPTKFMGSGMLPVGAYVTYEHEYVLLFRKGLKRSFTSVEEKKGRRESAFFWEERNKWFSDVWMDLVGTVQGLGGKTRARSAAFPFELAFRLISMHSVYGDTVFDPFVGTGTTLAAAIATGRNGIGMEIDSGLSDVIERTVEDAVPVGKARVRARLREHVEFVRARQESGSGAGHWNEGYGFPVMSSQEEGIRLYEPSRLTRTREGRFEVEHTVADTQDGSSPVVSFFNRQGSGTRNGTLW
jgi:modification methylase